ncbi:MAG TPA: DUF6458 family protein [Pilimelia sp.]|nr:DUF6458 family protein [Pilimelia sp.]
MGIGGGIFLIALGAILRFAVNVQVEVLDLHVIGWVLMVAGAVVLVLTVSFWHNRRQRAPGATPEVSILEETRIAHGHAVADPESPASRLRPPAEP